MLVLLSLLRVWENWFFGSQLIRVFYTVPISHFVHQRPNATVVVRYKSLSFISLLLKQPLNIKLPSHCRFFLQLKAVVRWWSELLHQYAAVLIRVWGQSCLMHNVPHWQTLKPLSIYRIGGLDQLCSWTPRGEGEDGGWHRGCYKSMEGGWGEGAG